MNKRELNKIHKLMLNEEISTAKSNMIRLLKEETEKQKNDVISRIEKEKDMIDVDSTLPVLEKDDTVDDIASSQAMDDIRSSVDVTPSAKDAAQVFSKDVDPNSVNYDFVDIQKDLERLQDKFRELQGVKENTLEDDLTDDHLDGELTEDISLRNLITQDLASEILEAIPFNTKNKFNNIISVSWKNIPVGLVERFRSMDSSYPIVSFNGNNRQGHINYNVPEKLVDTFKTSIRRSAMMYQKEDSIKISKDFEVKNPNYRGKMESVMEEYVLQKIKVPNQDGMELDGEHISQNDISLISGNDDINNRADSARPIEIIPDDNDSFALQKPPAFKTIDIKAVNRPDYKVVPKDGDPNALLNSNKGFGKENDKSPISGEK